MFEPYFNLRCAGFDAHKNDPLSYIYLTSDSYYRLTKELTKFANIHCEGRIVSTLEGGYNLVDLAESTVNHVKELVEVVI